MKNTRDKKLVNRKGFTLIELLIVIGIITILASAVIIAINPGEHFKRAREATRDAHANSIVNAVYSFAVDNDGVLPDCDKNPAETVWSDQWDWDDYDTTWEDYEEEDSLGDGATSDWNNERPLAACGDDLAGGDTIYLPDLPRDPQGGEYYTIASDEDGTRIQISTSAWHPDPTRESNMKVTQ